MRNQYGDLLLLPDSLRITQGTIRPAVSTTASTVTPPIEKSPAPTLNNMTPAPPVVAPPKFSFGKIGLVAVAAVAVWFFWSKKGKK